MRFTVRTLSFALMISTTMVCTLPAKSWGMLAPSPATSQRTSDMKTVQTALESKAVSARLKTLGLSDREIETRLGKLTDQQLHQLSKDVETLGSGGLVVELLVVVVLVLLAVYLVKRV